MPIQPQRHRAMLTGVRNLVADAHPAPTPSRHAHWRAERNLTTKRVAQPALAADGASRPRDQGFFES